MTAHERTGFRDESVSRRHREWGYNLPSVDADFVLVEYDTGQPKAIVDYKERRSSIPLSTQSANMSALGRLYDERGHQLPFIVAYYDSCTWAFKTRPMNDRAVEMWHGPDERTCTELEWVTWLSHLRGRPVDPFVRDSRMTTGWDGIA